MEADRNNIVIACFTSWFDYYTYIPILKQILNAMLNIIKEILYIIKHFIQCLNNTEGVVDLSSIKCGSK